MTYTRPTPSDTCPTPWCTDHDDRTGACCHVTLPTFEEGAEHMQVCLVQVGDLPPVVTIDSDGNAFCSLAEAVQLRDTLDVLIRLAGQS